MYIQFIQINRKEIQIKEQSVVYKFSDPQLYKRFDEGVIELLLMSIRLPG